LGRALLPEKEGRLLEELGREEDERLPLLKERLLEERLEDDREEPPDLACP
jgi:hypothetical protein